MKTAIARFIVLAVVVTCVYGECECFTYTIKNVHEEPNFREEIRLNITRGKTLYSYMEEACTLEPDRFTRFTATFFPKWKGYFIDSINGVASNWTLDKSYWEITDKHGPLKVGASLYIPKPQDEVMFNLTIGM